MSAPEFLDLDEILEIHALQLDEFGGIAAYEEAANSQALAGIDLLELASYLNRPTASQAIREYRAALLARQR